VAHLKAPAVFWWGTHGYSFTCSGTVNSDNRTLRKSRGMLKRDRMLVKAVTMPLGIS